MCDYSLMSEPNRLAREGEKLVTYRFPHGSIGLAEAADVKRYQSCGDLPPGWLGVAWFLCGIIILACQWGAFRQHWLEASVGGLVLVAGAFVLAAYLTHPRRGPVCAVCIPPGTELHLHGVHSVVQVKHHVNVDTPARFTSLSAEENRHRDAVIFPNGRVCSLQSFGESCDVTVVRLVGLPEPDQGGRSLFPVRQ